MKVELPPGKKPPEEIYAVIEIPKGSRVKYEVDVSTGFLFVNRFLYTATYFPYNYGFIPGTEGADGDPLDVLIIASDPVYPGVVIECKPIGLLEMFDESGEDNKVISIPLEKVDPEFSNINDIDDISDYVKKQIWYFFEQYKVLEPGKWTKVVGWKGYKDALRYIEEGIKRYRDKVGNPSSKSI